MITRDEAAQMAAEAAGPPDAGDGWALAEFGASWLDRPGNRGGVLKPSGTTPICRSSAHFPREMEEPND